jgi:hypothetical protein
MEASVRQIVSWVRVFVLVASLGLFWAILVPRIFPWAALLFASLILPVLLWPRARSRSMPHLVEGMEGAPVVASAPRGVAPRVRTQR